MRTPKGLFHFVSLIRELSFYIPPTKYTYFGIAAQNAAAIYFCGFITML